MRIDRYEVVGELGRGGMGVVYEVRDPNLERRLALKLILDKEANPDAVTRFGREAQAMAKVNHPGVVKIHGFGRTAQGPYLITELVKGEDLKAVSERGPVPVQQATEVVQRLARAVHALHEAGVLHRDLKPANVILKPDGQPVLLDFGLARDEDAKSLTETGSIMGTPAYMSPEQASGERSKLGPATDVYGLGTVLYALLAGRPPFSGPLVQVLHAVMLKDPPPPSGDRADIPRALEAVLAQAMAKDPVERYASAATMADDLERFARGETPLAHATRVGRRRKHLALVAFAALALAVGLGLMIGLADRGREGEDDPKGGIAGTANSDPTETPTPPVDRLSPEERWLRGHYVSPSTGKAPAADYEEMLSRFLQAKLWGEIPELLHERGHFRAYYEQGSGRLITTCERNIATKVEDVGLQRNVGRVIRWPRLEDLISKGALTSSDGELLFRTGPSHFGTLSSSPNGTMALGGGLYRLDKPAEGGWGQANVWLFGGDLVSPKPLMLGGPPNPNSPERPEGKRRVDVTALSCDPKGELLALGYGNGTMQLLPWKEVLNGAAAMATSNTKRLRDGHKLPASFLTDMRFSRPNGDYLASTSGTNPFGDMKKWGEDIRLRFWKVQRDGARPTLTPVGAVGAGFGSWFILAAHPNHAWVAAGTHENYQIHLYDMATGGLIRKFVDPEAQGFNKTPDAAHNVPVNGLAFSPDGALLITTAGEEETPKPGLDRGELRIWSVGSGKLLAAKGFANVALRGVSISADGKQAITSGFRTHREGVLYVWDIEVPKPE